MLFCITNKFESWIYMFLNLQQQQPNKFPTIMLFKIKMFRLMHPNSISKHDFVGFLVILSTTTIKSTHKWCKSMSRRLIGMHVTRAEDIRLSVFLNKSHRHWNLERMLNTGKKCFTFVLNLYLILLSIALFC